MKDCLILGFPTALMYKDVYPLLRDKVLKAINHHITRTYDEYNTRVDMIWFSTLEGPANKTPVLNKHYNQEDYPTYDNAPDIIECTNKKGIPIDYQGKIGVPVTFFYYYPELPYEILEYRGDLKLNGKNMFARLVIRRKAL